MTDRRDWSAPGRPGDEPAPPTASGADGGWSGGGWGQPGPGQPAPSGRPSGYGRPGVIPLRPLSIGEILDGAVTAIRFNPRVMIGLSAVVAVVSQLVTVLVTITFLDRLGDASTDLTSTQTIEPDELFAFLGQALAVVVLTAVITGAAVLVLTGVLTVVVSRAVLGQRISAGEAWAMVRPQVWRLIGVTVLMGAGAAAVVLLAVLPAVGGAYGLTVLLLIVAVVAVVYAMVRLALAGAVVVLERATVLTALRRSWDLVATAWWRTFGVLALTAIITQIVASILALPFGLLSGTSLTDPSASTGLGSLLVSSVGSIIGAAITWPFAAAVTVLLYVDRRMRREGLDLELARAAGVAPDGPQA